VFRTKARIFAGTVLAAAAVVLSSGTAHANNSGDYSTSYVDGGDAYTDDWGENFEDIGNSLCDGCANDNTDIVLVWQSILYAEGLLARSGIDGNFGPATDAATEKWQAIYGLTADGWVGEGTWKAADNRLFLSASGTIVYYLARDKKQHVAFTRGSHLIRGDGGAYQLRGATGRDGKAVAFGYNSDTKIYYGQKTLTPKFS